MPNLEPKNNNPCVVLTADTFSCWLGWFSFDPIDSYSSKYNWIFFYFAALICLFFIPFFLTQSVSWFCPIALFSPCVFVDKLSPGHDARWSKRGQKKTERKICNSLDGSLWWTSAHPEAGGDRDGEGGTQTAVRTHGEASYICSGASQEQAHFPRTYLWVVHHTTP